jgi:hypothetical protein
VIGNSHITALKLAWGRVPPDGVSITFFGAGNPAWESKRKNLRLKGHTLIPTTRKLAESFHWTSGGHRNILVDDFDRVIVVALGFSPETMLRIAGSFAFWPDESRRAVSRECFAQAVTDSLTCCKAAGIAERLPGTLLVPQPFPGLRAAAAMGDCPWHELSVLWRECATRAAEVLQAVVAFQPEETIARHVFTNMRFCRGSVMLTPDLSREHRKTEVAHMNAEYGELMIKRIVERI